MLRVASSGKRSLSVFFLVMINVIAIDSLRNISSNAIYGLGVPFYYLLAAIGFMIPCALVTAELATHYPKAGGVYVWVERAFGPPWGFLTIWLQWIYNVFWYPTILSFIAVNIAYLIDPTLAANSIYMVSMVLILFLLSTLSNYFGMKFSAKVSTICAIVGTLIPMAFIIVLGVMWILDGHELGLEITASRFFPAPWESEHLAFFVIVLFSLFGLEMSAVHAEEVKNPQRDFPRALLYSSLLIVLSAAGASTAVALVVPHGSLNIVSGLDQALALFLKAFHLEWLFPIALLTIILGSLGGVSAWIIGPTKGLAVAADEGYAPISWARRNKKNVPTRLLWIQLVLVCLFSLLFVCLPSLSTAYWVLSNLTAELALLFYIVLFAGAIRLRYKNAGAAVQSNVYKIPGGKVGIWFVAGLGMMSCIVALGLSFIPPKDLPLPSTSWYEAILLIGIIGFSAPPVLYYWWVNRAKLK